MYFVGKNGQQTGPFSVEQLREMAANGQLLGTDLVWKDGMSGWEPASTLAGVFSAASGSVDSPAVNPVPLAEATVLPPVQPGMPAGPRPNGMALTGMILGIVSVTVGLCCCYGFPFNVAGIVFSIIGMNQIKADPVNQTGKQMAQTGLWCSIASIVIAAIMLAVGVAFNVANWDEIKRGLEKNNPPARTE